MTAHQRNPRYQAPLTNMPATVIPLLRGREAREAAAYRAAVRSVDCPTCTAGPGERCINAITNAAYLDRVPGHVARARAAAEAQP